MTIFADILEGAINSVPGARGAAFADWEGETVDSYSKQIGDTNLRLIGAHWGVVFFLARGACDKAHLGPIKEMLLDFDQQRVLLRRVTDEYFVVMALAPESNLAAARIALDEVRPKLLEQM